MSATYTHTKRNLGSTLIVLRFLGILYFLTLATSIIYLWLFTQNRFISTAEFKVSSQSVTGNDSGFAHLALPGFTDSGSVDSQVVIGFVTSADLLLALEKDYHLADHFAAPTQDFVFRLERDANLEERLKYYRKRIAAHFDVGTGMTVVTVDTFDPKLSRDIAVAVLERAEKFLNNVNKEIADKQIGFVRSELELAAKKVDDLNVELISIQNENNFIDPDETIAATMNAIEKLRLERLQVQAQAASLRRDSPNSPRIESLSSRVRSLDELISAESEKLSGPDKSRLNQLQVRFKLLEQKIEFAIRLRTGAESLLERTRVEAIANSRFLTIIQAPFLPEDVGLPRRYYATASLVALGLLMFLIFRAIIKAIFSLI
jgi:capsular polysaccharide transport system permease protein